jgi:hypothetical protein
LVIFTDASSLSWRAQLASGVLEFAKRSGVAINGSRFVALVGDAVWANIIRANPVDELRDADIKTPICGFDLDLSLT